MVDKISINHCSKGCFSSSSSLRKALLAVLLCVHVLWFHVLSNLLFVASKATMYVADADARLQKCRQICIFSMPLVFTGIYGIYGKYGGKYGIHGKFNGQLSNISVFKQHTLIILKSVLLSLD